MHKLFAVTFALIATPVSAQQSLIISPVTSGDSAPSISAAAAIAGSKGAVVLAPGPYNLATNPIGNDTLFKGYGTQFSGSYVPPGISDGTVLTRTGEWWSRALARADTADGASNESVGFFSAVILPTTTNTGSNEKDALALKLIQNDNSQYSGDTQSDHPIHTHDAGAASIQSVMGANVTRGRMWNFATIAALPAGTNGYVVGGEILVDNNSGVDQALFSTSTTKVALQTIAYGSTDTTAAFLIGNNNAGRFHYGLFAPQYAIRDSFLQLGSTESSNRTVLFDVSVNGQIGVGAPSKNITAIPYYGYRSDGNVRAFLESGSAGAYYSAGLTGIQAYSFGLSSQHDFRITGSESIDDPALLSVLPGTGIGIGALVQPTVQGNGAVFIANASTQPTGNPTGGVFLAANAGALTVRGTSGGSNTIGVSPPTSSSSPCTAGSIATDASYIYVCVSSGSWKRAALATF